MPETLEVASPAAVTGGEKKRRRLLSDPVNVAVAAVLAMFVVLGLVHAFGVPVFRPLDEPRHVAYAVELAHGRLPTVRDPMPFDHLGAEPVRGSQLIAAANHPPLYYVIVAVPIRIGSAFGRMAGGVIVARCLTLGLAAAALWMAFRALKLLSTPDVAVTAIALSAMTPAFVNCSAIVMNDALACLAGAGLYHAALAILVGGPSRRRAIGFAVWLAISTVSKFNLVLMFPPAVLAVVYGFALHDPRPARALRIARGVGLCAASLGVAAAVSGAFYYRNHVLYDDVTGAKALLEELHRTPRDPFLREVLRPARWLDLLDMMWDRLAGGVGLKDVENPARILFALGAIGALTRLVRERKSLRAPFSNPRLIGGAVVVMGFFCITLPIFEFYSRGGQLSPRYFFPMIWVPWFIVALGLGSIRSRLPSAAAVVTMSIVAFLVTELYLARLMGTAAGDLGLTDALAHAGFPLPDWFATLFLILFGVPLAVLTREIRVLSPPH